MSFGKDKMLPLKALMALLIVAAHLASQIDSIPLHFIAKTGTSFVAMFLFISGFGCAKSLQQKGPSYLSHFFGKRIWRILLPGILALLLFWLVNWDAGRNYGQELLLFAKKGSPPLPQLWYVVVISFFYLAFWFSFKLLPERFATHALYVWALLFAALTIKLGYARNWWICSLAFPTGVSFARHEEEIYAFCEKSFLRFAAILCLASASFALFYGFGNEYLWPFCYAFSSITGALLIARLPLEKIQGRAFTLTAAISYEIFLCHGIAMPFLRGGRIWLKSDWLYGLGVYLLTFLLAGLVHTGSQALAKKA